ncbi:MAG: LPS export ABC transporter permease LptF [Methylophilus sp.]|nr:LPS export ABC transporter permease LptF [Methylophilus sp.]
MKIFRKALSQELISTGSGIFLILLGIVIAQRAGYIMRLVARGDIPNDALTTLLGFNLLKFLPLILSLAIFLAVLLTLTRWHRDSEMVVWFSAGLGLNKWIKPILHFTLPVVVIITLLSMLLTPWAVHKADEYRAQLKNRDEASSISPGVFKESRQGDRIYFVESFDKLGFEVKNIFVQSTQHEKTGVIVASRGSRQKEENGDHFLVLEKGRRYETKPNSAAVSTTEFERYAIRIETKEVAVEPSTTPSKSSASLFKENSKEAQAELQWRLAIPVSALILSMLAVPLSFVDPRAGRSLNIMFALLIFIIYNNVLSIFQAWITQERISANIGLWPVHTFFLLLTIYMFYRRNRLLPLMPQLFKKRL